MKSHWCTVWVDLIFWEQVAWAHRSRFTIAQTHLKVLPLNRKQDREIHRFFISIIYGQYPCLTHQIMSSKVRPVQWHNTECVCVCVCVCVHAHAYVCTCMHLCMCTWMQMAQNAVFVLGHAVWVFGSRKCAAFVSLCSDCCKSGNISKACQPLCLNQPSGTVDCSKEDHNILTCAAGKYACRCDTVELGTAAEVSRLIALIAFIGHLSVWLQQNLVLQQELVDWLTLITFIWHVLVCVM